MAHNSARSVGVSVLVGGFLMLAGARESVAQAPPPAPPPGSAAPAPYVPPPGAPPAYTPPPSTYAPAAVVAAPPPKENSINGNPLGFIFGNYSLNYERLVNGMHGFIVEGAFAHSSASTTSGTETSSSKSTTYGGGAGYRWHWSGQQQSGFLGLMAGYTAGSGASTITSGGTTNSFDLTVKAPWVVLNVGKRWQWDSGLNLTFRIGGGWAKYTVSTTSADPLAQDAVKNLQDLLELLPIALDGELSLGYTF